MSNTLDPIPSCGVLTHTEPIGTQYHIRNINPFPKPCNHARSIRKPCVVTPCLHARSHASSTPRLQGMHLSYNLTISPFKPMCRRRWFQSFRGSRSTCAMHVTGWLQPKQRRQLLLMPWRCTTPYRDRSTVFLRSCRRLTAVLIL